ncbi:alpha/beta hydrolase [Flavobacterium sp.]|uniref:alpha/beta fold hydrolase n=1 Tax=Flavobacterium sp. TaxID=239 RepID=UPI0026319B8D|nr:alpha/beta hydrolase [Flavobacterium sp.]
MQKLLLLHGALGSQEHFNNLEIELARDFEVYRFNFKGHGGGEIPADGFSIPKFADEVLAFMNQNNLQKINIFGYSMGGYIGLYLAKNFPEKIEKLFTLATKWDWTLENASRESKMLNPSVIKEKVPKYAGSLATLHGNQWEMLMEKTAAMMLDLGTNPTLKNNDLTTIETPILVAVGDKDNMVSIEETLTMYRLLPYGQLLVLPNTTHPIDRIDPSLLAYQIKNFFL